jgi:ligand-binding sensor domain-containing protein/signal transduction histidine kinase/AraC-like DNA-binding protein
LKLKYLFLLLTIIRPGISWSQDYYFRNFQVTNGLSSNTITCITQDKKGFMWFGTRNGLNRFDGTSFKVFRNDIKDSLSIGSNSILSVFEDKKECLWVGTYEGVYKYDPMHESFTFFNKIPQTEVSYITEDNNNNIWFVANTILYKYSRLTNAIKTYNEQGTKISALSISEKGKIWYALNSGVLKEYEPLKDKFNEYYITAAIANNKSGTYIQTIYPVNDTAILVATLNQVLLYNKKKQLLEKVLKETTGTDNIQVHKIIRHSDTELWLGAENGLYILNLSNGVFRLIQKQQGNSYSLNDNVITDLYKDTEGGTWIGTFFGGINYYSKQLNQFQKYFPLSGPNALSGNIIHEICSDKYNNLWIGTEDAGLNKIDVKTGIIKNFMPGISKNNISYHNIHGLLADEDKLWIGTYEHGIDVLDLKTEKVVKHYEKNNTPNSLKSNFIVTIYKTKAGEILIGTWSGLYKYNRDSDDFTFLSFFKGQVQAIHEDETGTLWIGSYGNGIAYYNKTTGKTESFKHDAKDVNSIPSNYVNSLFEDSRKDIWFCTESGLCKYNSIAKNITRYTELPALGDNQIFKILEDDSGILWVSTSKGLISLNPVTKETSVYNINNGLLSDQFNYNSAYKSSDNSLYFGSLKGMISFKPSGLIKNSFIPPIYITGLQINNTDVLLNEEGSYLNNSVLYTRNIALPYNRSTISLNVASLSYSMPELNEYMYKMEGYDRDWTRIKTNRKIYYTKLPPGNYTFKIKGSSGNSGVWNVQDTTLAIKITPPVWATTWAYSLYALSIFAILFIILRYYYLAVKEKNKRKIAALEIEKEREIYNAKIEFFTNVAHEIRTPLTLIKLPLDKIIKQESENKELNESLQTMKKNTQRLIDLTNQLLDFRKTEANKFRLNFTRNDINDLVNETFYNFKTTAEQKNLTYRLEMPRIILQAYVDTEAFRKILNNLIDNAIKYSHKEVIVRLLPFNSDDSTFTIETKNDGNLIPQNLKEKIFEPFYRIKHTEAETGTGIGLPLARSLAELHKGVLDLKKTDGKYNIFSLSIPIHQDIEINLPGKEKNYILNDVDEVTNEQEIADNAKPFILLVEDNKEILAFIQKELRTDYNILKAYNGQEALEILLKENVQLVISDIMMPVMDGIEFCRKIKTDLQYSHIPIILLTAKNTLNSKIEGLEVGADAYIEKPFAFEHLQAQISNLLTNRNKLKEYFAHSPLTHIKGIACTKADSNFLEELNKLIYENITDIDIDVDKLAKLMNMSRGTFYRKIKGLSNLSPNELINLSRLKRAAELLAEGTYKINEVANMVGYSLLSNFSRDFHKQFGVSPSTYISNLKNMEGIK